MKYDEMISALRGLANSAGGSNVNIPMMLNDAADALDELQSQLPKWIPVKERLPEEKCKCLVYKKHIGLSALVSFTNDLESIDEYDFQGQKRWGFFYYDSEYGYCESLGVTHWMPLPEPPKEES